MVVIRFWESKPESKSDDLDLSPALYSYKISEYETRFGLAIQFQRKGSRGFDKPVMDELKMRGLI